MGEPAIDALVEVDRQLGPIEILKGGSQMGTKKENKDAEAWDEIEPDFAEVFKFETVGDACEGTLTETRKVWVDDPEFNGTIDPDDPHSGKREVSIYDFADADGEAFSVWGTAKLDKALPGNEGSFFRIEFLGKLPLDGGRTVNRFKILKRK